MSIVKIPSGNISSEKASKLMEEKKISETIQELRLAAYAFTKEGQFQKAKMCTIISEFLSGSLLLFGAYSVIEVETAIEKFEKTKKLLIDILTDEETQETRDFILIINLLQTLATSLLNIMERQDVPDIAIEQLEELDGYLLRFTSINPQLAEITDGLHYAINHVLFWMKAFRAFANEDSIMYEEMLGDAKRALDNLSSLASKEVIAFYQGLEYQQEALIPFTKALASLGTLKPFTSVKFLKETRNLNKKAIAEFEKIEDPLLGKKSKIMLTIASGLDNLTQALSSRLNALSFLLAGHPTIMLKMIEKSIDEVIIALDHFSQSGWWGRDFRRLAISLRDAPYMSNEILTQASEYVKTIQWPKSVFIVHGRQSEHVTELKEILNQTGLKPVVLSEQTSGSLTIPEKLEKFSDVGYAFIILTPDDVGALKQDYQEAHTTMKNVHKVLKDRARQNVMLEFGYFWGKIGRNRLFYLYKGEVVIPSDMQGIIYEHFDDSIKECESKIIDELKAAGYYLS